ncbi:LysR family transcriptional regulator [Aliikangiella maris]|uniref:LysR family transcriptional regulator n=2 Tax=Aliikangiella maris TaxID=3162458 RepID=A0ABV3MRL9_9GAMM
MNINQLRFTLALAQTNSFSKAAEQCCVAQPTLSNALSQLEDELSARLFQRTTRAVSLTPFGQHMLPIIESALTGINQIPHAARFWQSQQTPCVRIGFSPVVSRTALTLMSKLFKQENPEIELSFRECSIRERTIMLENDELDVVINPVIGKNDYLNYSLFNAEPLYFICGESIHRPDQKIAINTLSSKKLILTETSCDLHWVTQSLLQKAGVSLQYQFAQASSFIDVEQQVSAAQGSGILPRSKINSSEHLAKPLLLNNGELAVINNYFFWHARAMDKAHVEKFIDYLLRA